MSEKVIEEGEIESIDKSVDEKVLQGIDNEEYAGDMDAEAITEVIADSIQKMEEMDELKDKNLRLMAEMENLKRRNSIDVENAHKYGLDRFAKALLEIGDSLDMGVKSADKEEASLTTVKEGLSMTSKIFVSALSKQGVEQVGGIGDKFNPEFHEAISMVPGGEDNKNMILDLVQVGWTLNGRLLRPAMVVIGA
jgi:molecular chaperone GrpE